MLRDASANPMRRQRQLAAGLPYLCARLHARLPHLLTAAEFERLRGQASLADLLACLRDTDGRPELTKTVLDAGDVAECEAGLTAVLVRRVNSVRELVADSVPAYLDLVTGPWDLHHLRALCRRILSRRDGQRPDPGGSSERPRAAHPGTSSAEATAEMSEVRFVRSVFLPVGSLGEEVFRRAAGAESLDDLGPRLQEPLPALARDFRAWLQARRGARRNHDPVDRREKRNSVVLPSAGPLAAGAEPTEGSVPTRAAAAASPALREVELFLENWHWGRLADCIRSAVQRDDAVQLRRYVAWQADLTNLRTSLRFLGRRLDPESVAAAYVTGGTLTPAQFAALMAAEAIEEIYQRTPAGPLTAALEKGLLNFASTGRPAVFERAFDEQLLLAVRRWGRLQPVSVAWLLYYLARVRSEWINLKAIACGIRYRLPAGKVQGSLVYA